MDISRFAVSGWDDDNDDGIESERDPKDKVARRFLKAAEKGKIETVESLLKVDRNLVNVTDQEGYTPLHRACYENQVEVVKILLQNGANISAKTEYDWEPLHSCCRWNHVECATLLIEAGADVNAPSQGGQTPLHIAASHGASYDMVQLLLMHPYIDPTLKNNSDETAFDIAKRSSKYYNIFDMADPLLDYKLLDV